MAKKSDKIQTTRRPRNDDGAASSNIIPLKATRHVADRISWPEMATLNANELKSVYALLAYVSDQQHVQQNTVKTIVETHFGVEEVQQLKTKDYEEVIRFLVDINIEMLKN